MKVTPVNKKFGKYSPGEAFDLPDKTAKIFVKLGKLAKVDVVDSQEEPEQDNPSGPFYSTRMMQADPAPYGYKADGTPRQRPGRPAKSE